MLMRNEFAQRLAAEPWVEEAGLRPPMYGVLRVIHLLQPASQREVSDRVGLYPSDLVSIIDQLAELGWVDRTRDPGDRRRYQLSLTPAGREVLERLDRMARDIEDVLLEPLADELRDAFVEATSQLVDAHIDEIDAMVGRQPPHRLHRDPHRHH